MTIKKKDVFRTHIIFTRILTFYVVSTKYIVTSARYIVVMSHFACIDDDDAL